MDLLGSILGSMDKPPSASEREKKLTQGIKTLVSSCIISNYPHSALKKEQEVAERKSQKERDKFKQQVSLLIVL